MAGFIKFILIIVFTFGNIILNNAQVLENYGKKIERNSSFDVFKTTEKVKIKADLKSFPNSDFLFKVPAGSTVFIDAMLWFQTEVDTTFRTSVFAFNEKFKTLPGPEVFITITNQNIVSDEVVIIKGIGDILPEKSEVSGNQILYEKRIKSGFDDFFYLSILIPVGFLSLFKIIYPQFLKTIISPIEVFTGDDFSDSSSLLKFFSIHIVFFLIVINMFLVGTGMLLMKVVSPNIFNNYIGESVNQYFLYWLLGTIFFSLVSAFKFLYLKMLGYIFKMEKIVFSHYFYVLRIISIFIFFTVITVYIVKLNGILDLEEVFSWVMRGVFWIYLFIIVMLFLIIMNKVAYKNYHLFAYICMSELIPFLIISKLIIG